MFRKIAYSQVVLADGNILFREVVVFDSQGHPVNHFPLTAELPFVEWRDECFRWDGGSAPER